MGSGQGPGLLVSEFPAQYVLARLTRASGACEKRLILSIKTSLKNREVFELICSGTGFSYVLKRLTSGLPFHACNMRNLPSYFIIVL